MVQRVPHYYKDFTCIASECKDNCCVGGWEIDIDDETANYYLSLKGDFGNRLRESITRTDEYCFKLKDGKCPFLDNHNLCEIYQVLGEDKMGVVCTQFPRFTEYYGEAKETGIGLACEEAARIILADRADFSTEEIELQEIAVKDSELDEQLLNSLLLFREKCFRLLEHREITIEERLAVLLNICYELQEAINENNYEYVSQIANKDIKEAIDKALTQKYPYLDRKEGTERVLYAYQDLEVLSKDWQELYDNIFEVFYEGDMDSKAYEAYLSDFFKDTGYKDEERSREMENVIKYFCFRYMLKAVYDHDIFGKAQMMAANFLLLRQMEMAVWLSNNRKYGLNERMEVLHIFSRQVEYSPDNVAELSEEFLFDDIFDMENLCAILLADQ